MRYGKRNRGEGEDELPGQDSFLDIIANIVGILIILVMVVGVRASHAVLLPETVDHPTDMVQAACTPPDDPNRVKHLQAEIKIAMSNIVQEQEQIGIKTRRAINLAREARRQDQTRLELNMHRALIEADLDQRRDQLDEKKQREFDIQKQLTQTQIELDRLERAQQALLSAPPTLETIETVTTPLAQKVHGQEIHLCVKGGLVSIIPVETLMAEITRRVDVLRSTLQKRGEVIETVGPIDGYRLRLTLAKRVQSSGHEAPMLQQSARVRIDQHFKFLPVSDHLGQQVEQALMPGSKLHRLLKAHQRDATPVTIWVYTDSFDAFRPLKRALWEDGFPVAVRPMEPNEQIGASPQGTRSAAQ
jgi:hypothetical protein